jgi:prepilin-type N-terminal cleavage/methylation domain-containing protein
MKTCQNMSARMSKIRAAFTLVELLVVVAIVAVLIGLLLPAVQAAREASRRRQCSVHLQQQILAALNFESRHNEFPPGSREHRKQKQEGVGWRVLVLPFLEETNGAVSPNEEGGFSGDKRTIPPSVFRCPSVDRPVPDGTTFTPSDYEGVAGAGQSEESRRDLEDNNCGDVYIDGVFYPESHTRIAEITDGTSHTLAIGERTYVLHIWTDGVIWVKSPDKEMCMRSTRNIRWPLAADRNQFGYYVFDTEAPAGALRTMLLNDLEFNSNHDDVVPFALADGSLHMIGKSIDLTVLRELATRNGHEPNRWTP